MSLQVWLPLNGDLHNQGLSNITMTNANATLNSNGKIGSCYSFDGSSNRCYSSSSFDFNSTTMSISAWAKIDSTATTNGYICGLSQNDSAAFMLYYRASQKIDVIANGSSIQLNFDVTNYVDSWHHYVVVSTGTKVLLYIDNIFKGEKNYTATSFQSVWAYLGSRRDGADSGGAAYFKGQLNDVRIYNHALSPQEIEKISQGLVLHYQLNDTRIEETTNLLNSNQSHEIESVQRINEANSSYSGEYLSVQSSESGYYTFSAYINNISESPIYLRLGFRAQEASSFSYTNGNTIAAGKKGWAVVTAEKLPTHETTISLAYYVGKRVDSLVTNPLIYHAQLEKHAFQTLWTPGGTTRPATGVVYDCSGFGNNGTITGSLSAAAGSPRYKFATCFNDVEVDSICTNNTFSFLHLSPFTVSLWVNIDQSALANDTRNKYIIYQFYDSDTRGGFNLFNLGNENRVCCRYRDETQTMRTLYFQAVDSILQGWHMFTLVCDGSQISSFLDGIKFSTHQHAVVMNGSSIYPVYIGRRNGSAIDSLPEKYSDFRIYATALSNDQVNTLFRTSMIVNSDGTTSPRGLS